MSGEGKGEERGDEAPAPPLAPAPSPLVQLELAILTSELAVARPEREARDEPISGSTVLVVTEEAPLSRYIAECLGARADLAAVIVEGATPASGIVFTPAPRLVIADLQHVEVLIHFGQMPAILVVDEVHEPAQRSAARRYAPLAVLVRPFSARSLLHEVDRLLGTAPAGRPEAS